MVFTSNIFLFLFLPVFLLCYYAAKDHWRSYVIVLGSYLFYAWWRPDFLILFVAISYWNYWFGIRIKARMDVGEKKIAFRLLTIGVIGNLATLGYFKYANFGADVLTAVLEPLGINTFTLEHIILPLGISFYVFQALSYIVDIYRRNAEPTNRFVDFAAYIALFPQLVAGPILRYSLVDQQLKQRTHSWELFSLGACRFMLGFIKKVLIADSLAPMNTLFVGEGELQMADAWFGILISALQLYFDFSGYSDMAIGLGMMMGFRFAENFNQPYIAQSITEFWQRWHMTLADFLRDYVYMPLVRKRLVGMLAGLVITMVLSGLWHGPSFAFIFWGLFFGIAMVVERKLGIATKITTPYNFWRNARCMLVLASCMPLFFTGNLPHSLDIYAAMIGLNGLGSLDMYHFGTSAMTISFVFVALAWVAIAGRINIRYYAGNKEQYFMQNVSGAYALLLWAGFLLTISRLAANSFSPFLYFQF
ncbi:MAG: membrane-bound O-acyltransferase family protein [Gammaproteobacteria bacterium]|nr:membrane-bound O-acyltransferase family protein [Gammaproteobacteria bacterium]MBU1492131.1 membrane-bound O-acyltransferase family protein [Gammaproteobacteria bacterium]MBU2067323.1 membrane-bound O-acyltransferase family protein [Gammaproteobacteria bacterium]MBU2158465.1 membrane-bound O-acyltransferase family protein [Gammaproteobacteria bacterium]MBU2216848.1 membrane-bound O-acyltransferase family protein [Gammaproteobacteria bacterium]